MDRIKRQIATAADVPGDDARRAHEPDRTAPAGAAHGRRAYSRREAEVEDIVAALRPYGVLTRERLAHLCGAAHWTEPNFRPALARAVSSGRIRSLDGGLYEITDPLPDSGATCR